MVRRSSPALLSILAACVCLAAAPPAFGQTTAPVQFGHDDTRDGDEAGNREIHSGLFAGLPLDPEAQPDDQRNDAAQAFGEDGPTFEKFPFEVPEGDRNGSFSVTVTWQEAAVDLDVYVYKERSDGSLDPTPVAQAASVADPEVATRYEPIFGEPIDAATYWIYVDNWCSNDTDPLVVMFLGAGGCTARPAVSRTWTRTTSSGRSPSRPSSRPTRSRAPASQGPTRAPPARR